MMAEEPEIEGLAATDLAACACANLRKAARVVTQAYDKALKPTGLRATQFTVLATLATEGNAPLTRLAEALVMDRTTLTRNLKPLVRQGLIKIAHEEDERVRRVGLTEPGERAFAAARPLWAAAQRRLRESLGAERRSALLGDLGATVAAARGR